MRNALITLLIIAIACLSWYAFTTDGTGVTEDPGFKNYMPSILDLQMACNERGWSPPLKEDGVYGKQTKEAINYYNSNDMAKEYFE